MQNLSVLRNLKIALFHLGSGMADVLTTGVWNRIMISDLGFSATPIGLLVSLRYFLAPLGIWAGRVSDTRSIGGFRRLFWIWLGRGLMVLSTLMLGFVTAQLLGNIGDATPLQWLLLGIALLIFSFGNAISGSTFLALIYDRSTEEQRGRAVGIVWTFLLLGFTVGGIVFGLMLPSNEGDGVGFTPADVTTLFFAAAAIFTVLWFFSLIGEEKRKMYRSSEDTGYEGEHNTSFRRDLSLVWRNRAMRYFLLFLVLSMFYAFSQDLILEPFAGDVFGMEARVTNRFAAYWGSMAIIGSVLCIFALRRFRWVTHTSLSSVGVIFLLASFAVFGISAVLLIRPLVTVGLILLGIGLGLWNIGTLGLMMDMSPSSRAGTFLGFWTLCVTLARGAGVASGGIVRDLSLTLTGDIALAYGAVFILGVGGLGLSLYCLTQVHISKFKREELAPSVSTVAILANAMD